MQARDEATRPGEGSSEGRQKLLEPGMIRETELEDLLRCPDRGVKGNKESDDPICLR